MQHQKYENVKSIAIIIIGSNASFDSEAKKDDDDNKPITRQTKLEPTMITTGTRMRMRMRMRE